MEILLLLCILFATLLALFGFLSLALFLVGVWYALFHYHPGEERNYTGRLLQQSWRGASFWTLARRLCKHTAHFAADQPPDPLFYVCQPHGILALSAVLAFLSGAADRPGRRVLLVVHDWYFRFQIPRPLRSLLLGCGVPSKYLDNIPMPGLRNLMLALGCIDKSRASIENALCHGFSVAVLPGGVFEMGPPLVDVHRPFGILRIAHDYRVPVVRVFMQDEERVCWIWESEPWWNKVLRRWTLGWLGLGALVPFCPRVWAWPVLRTVGVVCHGEGCESAEALQRVYDETRVI